MASREALNFVVGREMDAVAAAHGTPRRTILLADGGSAVTSAAAARASAKAPALAMEIEDTPCFALLSVTGLVARTADDTPPTRDGRRSAHDVLRSVVAGFRSRRRWRGDVRRPHPAAVAARRASARAHERAAVARRRLSPRGTRATGSRRGGRRARAARLARPHCARHRAGRGQARHAWRRAAKDAWEVISLKDGDRVVGAGVAPDGAELVFVADDASLLHFEATQASARPQGRAGGGIAGIKLAPGAKALFFGVVTDRRRGRRDGRRPRRRSARHHAGCRQVDPLQRVPGEGPRDRRCARAALPEGRGSAASRVGWPGSRSRNVERGPGS